MVDGGGGGGGGCGGRGEGDGRGEERRVFGFCRFDELVGGGGARGGEGVDFVVLV